jgi:hypothetical protein
LDLAEKSGFVQRVQRVHSKTAPHNIIALTCGLFSWVALREYVEIVVSRAPVRQVADRKVADKTAAAKKSREISFL